MDLFGSEFESIPLVDGDVTMLRNAPLGQDYGALLKTLIEETPWRSERIKIWGKSLLQPRLTAWYGEPGATYTYSGIQLSPKAWTATILTVKHRVETLSRHPFNSVLLNYYRDHRDGMGFHSDDEPELGQRPIIASLSLGEERMFQLRHKYRKDMKPITIPLPSGSLLIMRADTQKNWKHGIPKERIPCGPRINLTFRTITPSEGI